jgi:hypothetical protein
MAEQAGGDDERGSGVTAGAGAFRAFGRAVGSLAPIRGNEPLDCCQRRWYRPCRIERPRTPLSVRAREGDASMSWTQHRGRYWVMAIACWLIVGAVLTG